MVVAVFWWGALYVLYLSIEIITRANAQKAGRHLQEKQTALVLLKAVLNAPILEN